MIPGQDGRAVEALCWVGHRLFSAGLNGEITEYDLENLRPKYNMEAYGGPIWTISSNSQGTLLTVSHDTVHWGSCLLGWILSDKLHWGFCFNGWLHECCLFQVGCEDGTVKLFEILEERIQFQRNLDRQKGKSQADSEPVCCFSMGFLIHHTHVCTITVLIIFY